MNALIEKLGQKSPVAVMGRILLERVFAPQKIDNIFHTHRVAQRERNWIFYHSSTRLYPMASA